MATRYFTFLPAAVFVLLFTGCSPSTRVNEKPKNSAGTDDKIFSDMRNQGLSNSTPYYLTEINSKAMRSFVSSYSNATDPKWVKYARGYVVYFIRGGIRHKVYYSWTGDHKCTIRQYFAENMPVEIRQLVESVFKDYSIFIVNEVTRMGKTSYEIKIEDKTSLKEIKIENGNMAVTNDFIKSN